MAKAKDSKFVLKDISRPKTKAKDNNTAYSLLNITHLATLIRLSSRSIADTGDVTVAAVLATSGVADCVDEAC